MQEISTPFEAVIGLETHIQIQTETKIFCPCQADSWGLPPNTNICPVCMGLPGVLPVLNQNAVEKAAVLAAAMHAEIQPISYFDRKNYFYPDLPKGYQITQFDRPISVGGYLEVPMPTGYTRRVNIIKLHLEEDAGKTKNEDGQRWIDFNRCGVPLVEMVTGPDLRSADEAAQYLIRLRQLLRWLGISEANMEKAQLRCDANVSIRLRGSSSLNTKTEIKNVNSIVAVRAAVAAEIDRQVREVSSGNAIEPWTLEWDETRGVLRKMRSKETAADYRYFREPDLFPLELEEDWRTSVYAGMPELPLERCKRFIEMYHLPEYDADILTNERSLSEYYEMAVEEYNRLGGQKTGETYKRVSNWIVNDVMRLLNEQGITAGELSVTPAYLAQIIRLVDEGQINTSTGKELMEKVETSMQSPEVIVAAEGLARVNDRESIQKVALEVIAANQEQVKAYQAGKSTLIGWFVGQVMRQSRGKADPQMAREILVELLRG